MTLAWRRRIEFHAPVDELRGRDRIRPTADMTIGLVFDPQRQSVHDRAEKVVIVHAGEPERAFEAVLRLQIVDLDARGLAVFVDRSAAAAARTSFRG